MHYSVVWVSVMHSLESAQVFTLVPYPRVATAPVSAMALCARAQGGVHADGAALQHGDAHRPVHPREAAPRPAAALQGPGVLCSHAQPTIVAASRVSAGGKVVGRLAAELLIS